MKPLLLVCLCGVALLAVPPTFAQSNLNLMGFSSDPLEPETCIMGPGNQVYPVHLFVSRPVNNEFDGDNVRDIAWISGFECRVWLEGDGFLLGWHYPVNAIDAGTSGNTVVGFAEPIPVIDGYAVMASLEIFLSYPAGQPDEDAEGLKMSPVSCGDPTAFLYMAPCRPYSSIPGMMAILDADDPDNPLVGTTLYGSLQDEELALLLEVQPVADESRSWGEVKALYR